MKYLNDLKVCKSYINKARDAEARGIDFNLSYQEWLGVIETSKCPVTGKTFYRGDRVDGQPVSPQTLTIERLDPRKGYVSGNVVAFSYVANSAKSIVDKLVHFPGLSDFEKIKILRKSLYQLEKGVRSGKTSLQGSK